MKRIGLKTILGCLIFLAPLTTLAQEKTKISYSLDSCINYALENNHLLNAQKQNTGISYQQLKITKGYSLPSVNGIADFGFTNEYENLNEYNTSSIGIQINQPIWQNGKIRSLIKQAEINTEIAEYRFEINKYDLIYSVRERYINLLKRRKLETISKETVSRMEVTVDAAKERYKVGVTKLSDVLKAETGYSNALFIAVQAETERKIAQQELLNIMGIEVAQEIDISNFLEEINHKYNSSLIT